MASSPATEQSGGVKSTLGVFTAWAGEAQWRRAVLLLLIAAALVLPGLAGHGPTDRDEARFVQASKQMLETGDFIEPRFQDGPRHQKPIGVYWAQTAAASALGGPAAPVWAYRIPSAVAGVLAVLLTAWAVRPLVGARAAFLAGAMIAGVVVLSFEARTAKTDAALLAATVAAMGALARLWFGVKDDPAERGWNIVYFWTALGVGVLVKGPIIFLPVGGAILWMSVRERSLAGVRRLGLGWGLIWMLLLTAPWFVAVGVQTDGAFFGAAVGDDLLGKIGERREGASLPPGVHLLGFLITFWPFTPLALMAAPYVWRWRRAPETAFLLAWIVPTWIVFELVATKLLHYTLPVFPAIAALAAAATLDGSAQRRGALFWIGALLFALPALGLTIGLGAVLPLLSEQRIDIPAAVLCALALAIFVAAWRWYMKGLWLGFIRAALIGAAVLYAGAYQFALPALSQIWLSERMAEIARPFRACAQAQTGAAAPPPLAAIRYHEPSLVFLAGTSTKLLSPEAAAEALVRREVAVVWAARRADERRSRPDEAERFVAALAAQGVTARALAMTTGFQYNGGRPLVATLYAADGDPRLAGCAGGA